MPYNVIDLGPFSGRGGAIGAAINVHGDNVVSSERSAASQSDAPVLRTANGALRHLDLVAGDSSGEAYAVNSAGLVVGASSIGEISRAASWQKDKLQVLSVPSGTTSSAALGVNDAGEIVGYVVVRDVCIASIWIGGDWFPLTTLAGAERHGSIARAVNNRGDVVGVAYASPGSRAFLWQEASGAIDLGTLGGGWSDAKSINERGEVVGVSAVRDGSERAFIWSRANGIAELGTLPGGNRSYALRINNRGSVVGFSDTGDQRFAAVLWERERCVDLTAEVPPGWLLSEALAINDSGTIVCRGHGRIVLLKSGG